MSVALVAKVTVFQTKAHSKKSAQEPVRSVGRSLGRAQVVAR